MRSNALPLPQFLGSVLLTTELQYTVFCRFSSMTFDKLEEALDASAAARRAIWTARISRGGEPRVRSLLYSPCLNPRKMEDFAWLLETREGVIDGDIGDGLWWVLERLLQRMSAVERAQQLAAAKGTVRLAEILGTRWTGISGQTLSLMPMARVLPMPSLRDFNPAGGVTIRALQCPTNAACLQSGLRGCR